MARGKHKNQLCEFKAISITARGREQCECKLLLGLFIFARYNKMNRDERMQCASDQLTDKVIGCLCKNQEDLWCGRRKIMSEKPRWGNTSLSLLVMSAAGMCDVMMSCFMLTDCKGSQTLTCRDAS